MGRDTLAMKLNGIILVKPENQGKLFSLGQTAEAIPLSRVYLAVLFDLGGIRQKSLQKPTVGEPILLGTLEILHSILSTPIIRRQ